MTLSKEKERKFKSCKRKVSAKNRKLPKSKRVNRFAVCRTSLKI